MPANGSKDIRGQLAGVFALSVEAAVEAIARNPLQFPSSTVGGVVLEYGDFPMEYSSRCKSIELW